MIPKRFYIATALENAEVHKLLAKRLIDAGHVLTYDWTTHGSVQDDPHLWMKVAQKEVEGVLSADWVIMLPGGRGTHTELGLAIASRKKIVVVRDSAEVSKPGYRTCIFYHHYSVVELIDNANFERLSDTILKLLKEDL